MPRPTNEEIYNKAPEIEEGSEAAIAAAQAQYPNAKVIEAEVKDDGSGSEITLAYVDADGTTYHVVEVTLDANNAITGTDERPNVPPGQAKRPLKERKPHGKFKP